IVGFAMPEAAYLNPMVYGTNGPADLASWVFSFILIDGKMRGLFSFLFGASTLLVIERAKLGGQSPAAVHYRRMLWLLVFGLLHFYFIWFGDILAGYALCGLLIFLFRNLSVRALVIWGIVFVAIQVLLMAGGAGRALYLAQAAAAPGADAALVEDWRGMQEGFAPLAAGAMAKKLAMFHGPWSGLVADRLGERWAEPFASLFFFGWETIGYMLFGMAALKSGFLRGEWPLARYRKWAFACLGVALPVYLLAAVMLIRTDFATEMLFLFWLAVPTPVRPLAVLGIAALIILLTRKGGALVDRIAAAGRAAFTNYLGTSILMTTFFYGYGLDFFGSLSRIELWIPVLLAWVLMLAWSKPWLDRFRYGPFEWLWRSLARWRLEPMRRSGGAAAPAS
ncbi:MAG TPA: DUF418 domain-containing protein, partial [Allosphingosinicella sp.]|nr:DUF418 domain-containing protein [Allosphingosinicella sp.]